MQIRSLRTQLIAGLVAIGIVFTVISSALQLFVDYQEAVVDIEEQLDIAAHHAPSRIAEALNSQQPEQIRAALNSLITMPAIESATLSHAGTVIASTTSEPETQRSIIRQIRIPFAQDELLLQFNAPLSSVYQKLYRHASLTIFTHSLRILLAAIFVALFIDRLVMRPILLIAQHLRHNTPGKQSEVLELKRRPRQKHDELDELVTAINSLQSQLSDHQTQLVQEKDRYVALIDNNPQAIWRCQVSKPLNFNWDINRQVQHLKDHTTVVEANSAAMAFNHTSPATQGITLTFITNQLWQALAEGKGVVKDAVTRCVDQAGNTRYFSSNIAAVVENNECRWIWGISNDITPRVNALQSLEEQEKQLHASQLRLAEAQALAHMGHWDYRTYGDDLHVSEEFCRIYGYLPNDPAPTWAGLIARMHPDDRSYVIDALSNPSNNAIGAEHRIIWPNGEERHVQAVARKQIQDGKVVSTFGIILDITDRRRAEDAKNKSQQALIESEARMAEAQAIAHLGHWIMDHQQNQLTCSDEFYRIYGHQPCAFPANSKTFLEQVHPDDRERIRALLYESRKHAVTETYRIVRPNGEIRFIRGTATPFYSGGKHIERVFGISMDITDQKLAEEALHASQQLVNTAFSASPDGIAFIHSETRKFIASNTTFSKLTGYSEEELIGTPIDTLLVHDANSSAPKTQLFDKHLTQQQEVNDWEIVLETKNGKALRCLVSWRTVNLQGHAQKLLFLRDVTQLRELEFITAQQTRQLLHADKLASLGTMVAGVAHEINNPNHILQMNSELLGTFNHQLLELIEELPQDSLENINFNGLSFAELSQTIPELFDDMKSCCRRIDRIVKDLKDFSRPRDNAEYLSLDLNSVIQKSQNLLSPAIEDKKIGLELNLSPVPRILGDSQQLQQVIVNLTMNAIDASAPEDEPITIHTHFDSTSGNVVCEICDHGCGIADENLHHIFDPFFTTKQEQGGTGLGLSISFQLVREHGGLLQAESTIGRGTTIRMSIPAIKTL